jgi:hypothetical protein
MATTAKKKRYESVLKEAQDRRENQKSKLSLPCPANKNRFCHFPRCPAAAQPSGFYRCRFDYSERS